DVAMDEIQIALVPEVVLQYAATGREVERRGNRDEAMAPHGCYPCQGLERWIAVAIHTEAQWQAFAQVLGHPELLEDARFADVYLRHRNEDALDDLIWQATSECDGRELADRLQAAGVPATLSTTAKDLIEDPHLAARGFFEEVDQPEMERARLPQVPWRLSGVDRPPLRPAPRFAESTEHVLKEVLGLSDERIDVLRRDGVVL